MIKDGYDSQIKQYDLELNGYTKQTANGKKHFFGAAEISQMFESAMPAHGTGSWNWDARQKDSCEERGNGRDKIDLLITLRFF